MFLYILCSIVINLFSCALGGPILGGSDATVYNNETNKVETEYKYVVFVVMMGTSNITNLLTVVNCVGVILRPDVMLIAAHCLKWAADDPVILISTTRLTSNATKRQVSYVDDYFIHENYTRNPVLTHTTEIYMHNDIALAWLRYHLKFNDKVSQALLVNPGTLLENSVGHILGWGKTDDRIHSSTLQKGEMKIIPRVTCQDLYGVSHIPEEFICAISDTGETAGCSGDGGGPLVVDGKVVGLLSYNSSYFRTTLTGSLERCNPKKPAIFTNIARYRDWIETNLKLGSPKHRAQAVSAAGSIIYSLAIIFLSCSFLVIHI